MIAVLITCALVFLILAGNEYYARKLQQNTEISRKFVHVLVGTFVAFWPLYLSWNQIIVMSIAFLVVNIISRYFNVFRAIHNVQRPTWGELLFAIVIGLLAILVQDGWIFAIAVLHMALADGFAAIFGLKYGTKRSYMVFGQRKTVLGTLVFCIISVGLLLMYSAQAQSISLPLLISLAAVATFLENTTSNRGFDNLTVPLFVALALALLG